MRDKLKVVLFAGGRGASTIVDTFTRHPQLELTILVNAYDDGLSTGALRRLIPGMLGPSDIRKNLGRLMATDDVSAQGLRAIMDMRFEPRQPHDSAMAALRFLAGRSASCPLPKVEEAYLRLRIQQASSLNAYVAAFIDYLERHDRSSGDFSLSDVSLGNILLAGAYLAHGRDFNAAVDALTQLSEAQARVLNITDGQHLALVALKEDGTFLRSEAKIVGKQSPSRLKDIYLIDTWLTEEEEQALSTKPLSEIHDWLLARSVYPRINPAAEDALLAADLIVYGPGTQHSSLLPSYLTSGVGQAIAANRAAEKVYVSNILQDHEIRSETASSLTDKFLYYLSSRGRLPLEWDQLVTTFFFQIAADAQEPGAHYLQFDQAKFPFPLDNVVFMNWEAGDGRHSGGRVLGELTRIVNARLQTQIRSFHYLVSIIVPGLNERRTVSRVLEELSLLDLQPIDVGKEIIYVDGGSSDGSLELARSVRGVQVLQLSHQRGRGAALRLGIRHATGDIIVFFPCDAEYAVSDLRSVILALAQNEYRAVFGSRAAKCVNLSKRVRDIYGDDWFGYLTSKYGGMLISIGSLLLYNRYVNDTLTGIKAFDGHLLRSLELESCGIDLDVEIVAKLAKRGEYLLEIPVEYHPRTRGEGKKTTVGDGIKALWRLLALSTSQSKRKAAPESAPEHDEE